MNNYNGTLIRVFFIFVFLISFWLFLSIPLFFAVIYLFNLNASLSILIYIIIAVLFIRVFYPKFIFRN
ncbi:putative membrane protein [Poseidonibacter lekithochrous]|nr:putative membrane protein [Poseidonibacter lekithochrous]